MKYRNLLTARVVQIWHTYTDACKGFELFLDDYLKTVPDFSERLNNEGVTTLSILGDRRLFRRERDIIAHNKSSGINYSILGQMAISQIAGYWNDIREQIEHELGLNDKMLFVDPFLKEIVDFRNMVLHKDGKADNRVDDFKYFTWLKEGELITLSICQMETFIIDLLNKIDNLEQEYLMYC